MRVLVITRDLPFFPGGHGGNARTFSLIRALAPRHRFTVVTTVHTAAHRAAARDLEQWVERVEYAEDPAADRPPGASASATTPASAYRRGMDLLRRDPRRAVALAIAYSRAQLAWLPRESAALELTFENMRAPLYRALGAGPYDVLHIECSDNARWVEHVPFRGPKVLIVHDVKTMLWRRRCGAADGLIERGRTWYESARFAVYERRYLRRFDAVVAMSDADRDSLQRLTHHPHIAVVPNGVDLTYFQPAEHAASEAQRVIFTATLDHPPNRDGILFFVREIWPLVRREEPSAQLDIVGANPPADVRALAGAGIRVTGFVADVRPYVSAARVFVCPLRFASGTRLKILEAMAMGTAVVSTTVGAEGIESRSGHDLHIADAPREFARRVVDLLRDPAACTAMGKAARASVMRYDWARCAERLDDVYTDVRRRYVARRAAQPLRVGLNALFVVPGGATGGLEPYVHHLITHLLRLDRDTRYVLLASRANALALATLRGENLHRHTVRTTPGPLGVAGHVLGGIAARLLHLPQSAPAPGLDPLAHLQLDLVHSFPGYIDAAVSAIPSVLTVADLQHEYYPEFFDADELAMRRASFPRSAQRALKIIAISEFTRRGLVDRYAVPAEKISVIPLGVAARFFAAGNTEHVRRVRLRYRLPDVYCIYAANVWPHKNHLRLLDAMARLPTARRPHLVLTGAVTRARISLPDAIRERDLSGHVTWLGFVDDDEMPALFAAARMMVCPSLFEGFGMPVLEAMAAGCPVACANTTALPDTAADAAQYFDPRSADAIAAAIEALWHDVALQTRLRAAGHVRARQFTWQRTALHTLHVYRQAGAIVRGDIPSPHGEGLS